MRARPTAVALAAAVALAGCGSSAKDEPNTRSVTAEPGKPVPVTATEYKFDPGTIVIPAEFGGSGKVEFALKNAGSLAHDLKVRKDGEEIGGTPTFTGGKTMMGTVEMPAGQYEFFCSVGDHENLGMKGKITVK